MSSAQSTPSKYAEQLTDWLVELGYTHCYFVAGGNIMHLLDGARTRFTCIPVVHEVAAGIAVEYFNEANGTGRAFAMVTAGPGVSNIITAMSGAWLESRELLVIAGQVKSQDLATGGVRQRGIQEIDGVGLAKPVAKCAVQLRAPIPKQEFFDLVNMGSNDRPGPVFIELCLDTQGAPPLPVGIAITQNTSNSHATKDELEVVIQKIRESHRPVLLVGGGVSRETAQKIQQSITESGIPVMTTWNGADRIDASHPQYLGRPNTWGQRAANLLMAQADVIVAVGTRLGMQQTGFNWQEFGRNAFVVQVDIDKSELEKGHPKVDLPICGDADSFLEDLLPKIRGQWDEWITYAHEVQEALPLNDPENETGAGFVSPYDFYADLSELATQNDVIIPCSSGGANSVSMQVIKQKFGQVVITDKGLASMGYGLGGAIGAAMAHPGRRTFLIEGDGGFAQNLQELATVAVNRLPIKIFIFANNGYGSIRMTQKNYFGGAYLGCDTETGLGFPDWHLLFESFGIPATTVDANWASDRNLIATLESAEPHGYIIPIDPLQTYWPKIMSRIVEGGGMESNPLHKMSPDLPPKYLHESDKVSLVMSRKPLISIAIPAYNEAENIPELWHRLTTMFQGLESEYDFEVVVCENGSHDNSYEKLTEIRDVDNRLKIVRLSRNFHMEGGMLAALSKVSGDACVVMSADLQDPPEMIPEMIKRWRGGDDHVYTVITHRHGESKFRRVAAEIFYWMIDRISDTPVPRNASDFRLVDKQMYEVFNALPEKDRMVRAVWGWIGFQSTSMEYERPARTGGTSSFNPFVTGAFAIRGMLASSLKPLKLIPIAGLILSGISFIALIVGVIRAFIEGVPSPGFGTITSLILLMFGILFLLLSVLAEYIGMIYTETRARPTFILKNERSHFE